MSLLHHLRPAVSSLRRSPGYVLAFAVTLGLGIGPTTAILSAVYSTMIQPLPYRDGGRLVYLQREPLQSGGRNLPFSVVEIEDIRSQARTLERVGELSTLNFTLLDLGEPRQVRAGIVSGNFFEVVGLGAAVGRAPGPSDDEWTAEPVAVLTHRFWLDALNGDSGVVGRRVRLNGIPVTVVGVVEPAPPYPERIALYANVTSSEHHLSEAMNTTRGHRMTRAFARLEPGASVTEATSELQAIMQRMADAYPGDYQDGNWLGVSAVTLNSLLSARVRTILLTLLAASAFVLLIAVANVGNLVLTRNIRRQRELAIRLSLGATPVVVRKYLFVETILLAGVGTAVGLVLAAGTLGPLREFAGRYTVRASEISLSGAVLAITLAITVGAAILLTILPGLPSAARVGQLVKGGGRSTRGEGSRVMQRALVVLQVSSTFVLLIGGGLLTKTLWLLSTTTPDFGGEDVLAMEVPTVMLAGLSQEELRNRHDLILGRVKEVPGVEAAAWTSMVPLSDLRTQFPIMAQVKSDERANEGADDDPWGDLRVVSPAYFDILGVRLLEGRAFSSQDRADSPPVAILNQAYAEKLYPGRSAVGRRVRWSGAMAGSMAMGEEWYEIVGVVENIEDHGVEAGTGPLMYRPYAQLGFGGGLVVRGRSGSMRELAAPIREAIRSTAPEQPIGDVATFRSLKEQAVSPKRLNALLIGLLAVISALIAAVGISGVLAFSVTERTREIGIRTALGATGSRIRLDVMKEALSLAGAGLAIGLLGSLGLSRLLASQLFGVSTTDTGTFLLSAIILAGTAVAGAYLPARRASRVAPVEALRAE